MSLKILKLKPPRTLEVETWLAAEIGEQIEKYKKIAHTMNVEIAEQREQ
jgi:hypothetical protein